MAIVTPIRLLQGEGLYSSYDNKTITTTGVVTTVVRKGFFLQTPNKEWDQKGSDGIFVYSMKWTAEVGMELTLTGRCTDYVRHDSAKPVTQLIFESAEDIKMTGAKVKPINLTQSFLQRTSDELVVLLNSLEGMLMSIDAGQTFIAPSNRFGDYVVALDKAQKDTRNLRTKEDGMLADHSDELRWMPGFRVVNYNHAKCLNVGATLTSRIEGPLNYRADSYQLSVTSAFSTNNNVIRRTKSSVKSSPHSLTIMTLNCFNLDPKVELGHLVKNSRSDIDDDWGEGRFHALAQAIVHESNCPDIIALQEIQDNDGAELSAITDASETYKLLSETIEQLCKISYQWIDIPPELDQDGGQPGGNIRNGFLYNPKRATPVLTSLKVLGKEASCFENSRKPIICDFIEQDSGLQISIINVHLASKRHQTSIFAPENAGVDGKLSIRVQQAELIQDEAMKLLKNKQLYYLTGDFNDTEHSDTLAVFTADTGANLVMLLEPRERYDYNHRGQLQVLMHGIVPKSLVTQERVEYEIIHGNELIGIKPGEKSDKPSDHAYVIAKIAMS